MSHENFLTKNNKFSSPMAMLLIFMNKIKSFFFYRSKNMEEQHTGLSSWLEEK